MFTRNLTQYQICPHESKAAVITAAVALVGAGAALGVAATKAAPRVKSKLSDLGSKLNRRANDAVGATGPQAEPEQAAVRPSRTAGPHRLHARGPATLRRCRSAASTH